MPLPRFTSGKLGNLEFSHLNDVFDFVDAQRDPIAPKKYRPTSDVILVRVTGKSGSGATELGSFVEVAKTSLTTGTYTDIVGGVTSTGKTSDYDNPIVATISAVGSIVPVLGHVAADGTLYFKECAAASSLPSVVMGEVISYTGGQYTLSPRKRTASGWIPTGGSDFYAFNGAENVIDDPPTRSIGVGSIHPVGSSASRRVIKNGVIVMALEVDGIFMFSCPNGYLFTCT